MLSSLLGTWMPSVSILSIMVSKSVINFLILLFIILADRVWLVYFAFELFAFISGHVLDNVV
ncbi:hypothetical protein BpHYR1_000140 [Brachionus plicatilis]|uniref:Uncharacterized protein n=1 Tax=Brachionus plicatilis TaxID=10195 RepID=A0A3M7SD73_BRAPC|nr:hypothetical protein BpHYR1_000140 [Brachionus plicatilis]